MMIFHSNWLMQTEALFENIADRIEQELTQAEQSIYIAVAWFTNPRLFDLLLTKAKQGITVQLLISNDPINQQSPIDYSGLNIGNSIAYMIGDGKDDLMHNKFCVIDEYTVINGSYNWSKKAERNHENIIIIIERNEHFFLLDFLQISLMIMMMMTLMIEGVHKLISDERFLC